MKRKPNRFFLYIQVFLFCAAVFFFAGCGSDESPSSAVHKEPKQAEVQFWTCSMHPQIHQSGPGQCPLCGMNLIPVSLEQSSSDEGNRELKLSSHAVKLSEIQTVTVERKFVDAEIRLAGKVEYDESRLSYITAWVPGRIERLFVDYTGVEVNKGDHLVQLYSPELITAQQELILGLKMLQGKSASLSKSVLKNIEATREKLRLWGLTKEQIKNIEKSGKAEDRIIIYSPISGIVIQKNGFEGDYLMTGTRVFTLADLSRVWLKLDVYESDLMWIRYGQDVSFTVKAYPGEIFKGRINFIDPILDAKTRTVKVRVNVKNTGRKLKPGMFVSAQVNPTIAAGGKVISPILADKWICPMHPEIVKDIKDVCDICGMDLVTVASLGYGVVDEKRRDAPIVIPVTAPLITGKRAVVYVKVPEKEGTFEGREVVLGPRAGAYYIVNEGLKEGDRVVVKGNFKIDSAIQILAKPSMMNPEGGADSTGHEHHGQAPAKTVEKSTLEESITFAVPTAFIRQADGLLTEYFNIQQALSRDNFKDAAVSVNAFKKNLDAVDMKILTDKSHMAWMSHHKKLSDFIKVLSDAKDMSALRSGFDELSDELYTAIKKFGISGTQPVYRFVCPMANNNTGAYWLQNKTGTENPYFGSSMFKCGSQVETVSPGRVEVQPEGTTHE